MVAQHAATHAQRPTALIEEDLVALTPPDSAVLPNASLQALGMYVDLGRALLPHLYAPWLPDTLLMLLLAMFAVALLTSSSDHPHPVAIVSLWLRTHGCFLLFRTAPILATTKAVSPHALHRLAHGELPSSIATSLGFLANTNCFDMVVSGHAGTGATFTFAILETSAPLPLRAAAVVIGAFNVVAQVMVGDHYSADVVLGVELAMLLHILFRMQLLSNAQRSGDDVKKE